MYSLSHEQVQKVLELHKVPKNTAKLILQQLSMISDANEKGEEDDLSVFLEETTLSVRIVNALRNKRILTERQLTEYCLVNGTESIQRIRNIGENSYEELLKKFPYLREFE